MTRETIKEVCGLSEYVDETIKALDQRTEKVMSDKRCCISPVTPQQLCKDVISRQAVLNYIRDNYRRWFINDDAFVQCVNGIKSIISALSENKGEWNPLKSDEEGRIIGSLPEEGEEVLVTVYGQVEIDSFGCDVEYDESVGEFRNEWFCENNDIEDVRAWMPKPKPYKANREVNK